MTITQLPPNRWKEYKNLRLEAVQNSPQSFLATVQETLAEKDSEWESKINNMFFAVSETDELVGMAGCYRDSKQKLNHVANIVSVYVTPSYRGKGVGRKLLEAVIAHAKNSPGVTKLQLGVITTQVEAYTLYTSLGFQNVGTLKMATKVDDTYYDEYLLEMIIETPL